MADKDKKDQDEKAAAGKARLPFSVRFAIFILLVTAVVLLPFTIVFSVCMIPTFVAAIVDTHKNKTAWFTVGVMNLAGTIPSLFSLWYAGFTVMSAFQLIIQPMTIIISFGAASAGWLIYHKVPLFVSQVLFRKNEKRLKEIEKRQKELVKKWGDEVAAG
jgi:hypothetical protein